MTGPDFSTALATLGLDNHQAAAWLGVSVKSVRRYRVSGAPGPVERALGLAVKIVRHNSYNEPATHLVASLALDWRE